MSLLLCHECYTWVEPFDARCPECFGTLDCDTPDPALEILRDELGGVVGPLGEVRIRRRLLPDQGTLYATTSGLLFVPHETVREVQLVETPEAGSSLLWTLASIAFTPLVLVLPFVRSKRLRPAPIAVLRPVFLSPGEYRRPAELLMENPGVFFVPRRSIFRIVRRRGKWTIERRQGTPLKFKPHNDRRHFQAQMTQLAATDGWRELIAG